MRGHGTIATLAVFIIGIVIAQDCVWNKDTDFPASYPPLLIDKVPWLSFKPVLENGNRIVRVTEGKSIVVACSGTKITTLAVEVAEGVCSKGKILIGNTNYTVLNLACTVRIKNSAVDSLGVCGEGNVGTLTNLGFKVLGYQFYPIIKLCFEPTNQITLYSESTVYGKSVSASDQNLNRPAFKSDNTLYPTINPNVCYLTANQDTYVTTVTGDPDFIDLYTNNYFARGHLCANADFLTEMEADATFWYSNAVPQWQLYNAGNWEYLEDDYRQLANAHQVDLKITTGPLGILTFTDINNAAIDGYICDDSQQHIIPIPKIVWKVIYDPVLNQGLAVIISNVPNQVTSLTPVCPVIDCTTVPWLLFRAAFNPTDYNKGWTYCCTVQNFHAANPHAPDYPTAGLLLN